MNKKIILVLAVAVIMLLIGSTPSSYAVEFEDTFEDTFGDTLEEGMVSVHLTGSASLLDSEGNIVSTPTVNPGQLIDPSGTPVQSFQLKLGWVASGDQVDWDTFKVMINRKMAVYNPTGQGGLNIPLGTSIHAANSTAFQESIDLDQKIVNGLSAETLDSWGVIGVNYTFTVMATGNSINNESLSANVTKVVMFNLDWDPVTEDLEVDTPAAPAESTGQTEEETYQTSPIVISKDVYALSTTGSTSSKIALMSAGLILTATILFLTLRKRGG